MNWLTNFVLPKIRAVKETVAKKEVPENLWTKCSNCGQMLFSRDLEANLNVCGTCGFHLRMDGLTETGSAALAETIRGATLTSAQSTLAVSAQRDFALSETTRVTVKGRLGWSHEFADNTARIGAGLAGLSGSGFALNSAPIGRDANMPRLILFSFGAGFALVLVGKRTHLVGHIETVGLAGRPHAPGREQNVNAAARAQVEYNLSGIQFGERGRISASE